MATCYLHAGKFTNGGVCPRCTNCKHTSWWKKENQKVFKCSNCSKTTENPQGEKWVLNKEWELI